MSAEKVTRIYSNFRGVDFRGLEINLLRSPDALNVWKDYKETESVRTRPELKRYIELEGYTDAINGIFFYGKETLIHIGDSLISINGSTQKYIAEGLNDSVSNSFIFDNIFYFKDGLRYFQYDGTTFKEVEGYIPTTTIARKPMGGGTKYEDVNMLSDFRKNSFLADGASFSFFLDVMNIDEDFRPEVFVNDEEVNPQEFNVDYAEGKIVFL